jgi:hypothetical protein
MRLRGQNATSDQGNVRQEARLATGRVAQQQDFDLRKIGHTAGDHIFGSLYVIHGVVKCHVVVSLVSIDLRIPIRPDNQAVTTLALLPGARDRQ